MHRSYASLCVLLALSFFHPALSVFYLPGVVPVDFAKGDDVPLRVNKITSVHTQLPYKYYSLPFCKPPSIEDKLENIGEIIRGDRIENSLYKIPALTEISCATINSFSQNDCTSFNKDQMDHFAEKIKYDYSVHWIVDNLPAATILERRSTENSNAEPVRVYKTGFELGYMENQVEPMFINNHVMITLQHSVSPIDPEKRRIVGFVVDPVSRTYKEPKAFVDKVKADSSKTDAILAGCPDYENQPVKVSGTNGGEVLWTYEVKWEESNVPWTQRWDVYLANSDAQIHWFSIINSLMIVLFLTGMVAMIMMRTLRADLRRYNSMDANEEAEETGWKLVHGDVFRPPAKPMLLAVLIGSGVQVFGMTIITMIFAVLGFLSPANRGMLITAVVVLFVVMGVFAGYFSTRCYKTFRGVHWKKNTIMTAFAFPGTIFGIFFIVNLFFYGEASSAGLPASTLFSILALWCGISVPLVFFGSYFAFKKPLPDDPVRTNQIPRQIPEQVWYLSPILSILMGGILPFGAVFIELFFILTAIWGNQFYYIFGVLFIVFIILVLTCAEITIVMCYFQLCAEDYHWWWRSYLTAGASALYMFLYSIFYFFNRLSIDKFVSGVVYFGYTLIMTLAFFVLTGTIGFYACYFFVRKIYGSIKVD